MSLKTAINDDLHRAMKERDEVATAALRMLVTAVRNEEVAGEVARELSDAEVVVVTSREAKKRAEAAEIYAAAGRDELAARERAELAVLERYLPAALDGTELDELVAAAVAETGASGPADMGKVMRLLGPKVAGRADGPSCCRSAVRKGPRCSVPRPQWGRQMMAVKPVVLKILREAHRREHPNCAYGDKPHYVPPGSGTIGYYLCDPPEDATNHTRCQPPYDHQHVDHR